MTPCITTSFLFSYTFFFRKYTIFLFRPFLVSISFFIILFIFVGNVGRSSQENGVLHTLVSLFMVNISDLRIEFTLAWIRSE